MDPLAVVELLGSEYTAEILETTEQPCTASALSDELEIPIASTYRRLSALSDANLVREIPPAETTADTQSTAYQRTVNNIHVAFEADTIEISVDTRHGPDF